MLAKPGLVRDLAWLWLEATGMVERSEEETSVSNRQSIAKERRDGNWISVLDEGRQDLYLRRTTQTPPGHLIMATALSSDTVWGQKRNVKEHHGMSGTSPDGGVRLTPGPTTARNNDVVASMHELGPNTR